MANQVRFKRSDVPGKVPSVNDLELGEIAVNTFDGKLFTKQVQNGLSKIAEIGAMEAENVLYVSKSGNDDSDGRTLGTAKLTVKAALAISTPGTTIFVKSGEYIEQNPMIVPARVAIIGDSLRTVTIRPANTNQDIFWVNNGSYIFQLNFKGHVEPAAAVAFPPDGSAGYIVTSPYVQAVTSITSTGTGMRVDGAVVSGLRSMVVDAYTQYNQGGIGIHMLNRGNTQLVSVFTICCDISFLCEEGGFCSITNSNTSFGNYGLVSRGASPPLYYGRVKGDATETEITFTNLTKRPNIGDGILIANYNQNTCERDTGFIVDSLAFDLLYDGYTQSTFAGLRYWAKDAVKIPGEVTETAAALTHAKSVAQSVVRNITVTPQTGNSTAQIFDVVNPGTVGGSRLIGQDFDTIINIIKNGPKSNALIIEPDITLAEPERRVLREQILNAKPDIEDDTINYLDTTYPSLEYDRATCKRDVGLIIDAVILDMLFNSDYQSITAGKAYLTSILDSTANLVIPNNQKAETLDAIDYVKGRVSALLDEDTVAQTLVEARFDTIIDIIDNGFAVAPNPTYPATADLDQTIINAKDILQDNKLFIAAEVTEYLAQNYPSLVYDVSVCERDVKLMVDAISYDIMYGGNSQTVRSSERYYSYVSGNLVINSNEKEATLAAFSLVQLIAEQILINDEVTPLQLIVEQDLSNPASDQVQVARARILFLIISNIINTGIVGDSDTIIPNGPASDITGIVNSYQLLLDNKQFIEDDVVRYIAINYPSFTYDEATCRRDIEYIIDSVAFDLLHGGNRQSVQSGVYYYSFSTATQTISGEVRQTVNALEYLKSLVEDVITATPTPVTWQTNVEQNITLPAATTAQSTAINDRIDLIIDILENGPIGDDSTTRIKEAIDLTPNGNANVQKAFDLLLANRAFLQKELTAYINQNWFELSEGTFPYTAVNTATPLTLGTTATSYPDLGLENAGLKAARTALLNAKEQIKTDTIAFLVENFFDNFVFDKTKCYRDVGLILDAVVDDIVFGTNYKTAIAGYSYLRAYASEVITNQKTQTLAALREAKRVTLGLVVNVEAKEAIEQNFDIVINIIDQGISAVPAASYPNPNNIVAGINNAAAVLQANKNFIKAEVIAYINENLNPLVYDQEKCARDVEYIIEALAYDYVIETNYQTVTAGEAYLRANAADVLLEPQKTATLDAMDYLRERLLALVESDSSAVSSINTNLDTIVDIIVNGSAVVPDITFPSVTTSTTDQIDAVSQIQQNINFIKEEIGAYLNVNFNTLWTGLGPTSQNKCKRDVAYILDAVSYDILYGGNWASVINARSYFVGAVSQLGTGEATATIAAYNHLRYVLNDVIRGIAITPSAGNAVLQTTTGGVGSSSEVDDASGLVEIIINVIEDGNLNNLPSITYPVTSYATTLEAESKTALLAAKTTLPDQVVEYINTKPRLIYDEAACSRDVGLIIDALRYDLMFGSNFQSIKAAQAYYRSYASEVLTPAQKKATLDALEFVKSEVIATVTGNATAVTSVTNNMNEIIDIIDNGLTASNALSLPNPTGYDSGLSNARALILANTEFIKEELEEYLTINYPSLEYDKIACRRDVGYIIDALRYDLTYGGNSQSVAAAQAYYDGAILTLGLGEKIPTLRAYEYLKELVFDISQNISVTALQNDIAQTVGTAGTLTVAQTAAQLVEDIRTIINGISAAPVTVQPSTSWVAGGLIASSGLLLSAKSTIQSDTIDHINEKKYFIYDDAACERDVGLLVDALTYDLKYGGNSQTIDAGKSYFNGTGANVVSGEVNETVLAYQHMRTIVQAIVQNDSVTPTTGNTEIQNTGLSAGSLAAADILRDLMGYLINIVQDGSNEAPVIIGPNFDNGNATFANVRANLRNLRKVVQDETLDYVESRLLTFNKVKCARDIGLIIDAVAWDMIFNSNYLSIRAGASYTQYAASVVTEFQLGPQLAAINFIKDECLAVVNTNPTAVSRLTSNFGIIYDIIENGYDAQPAISLPSPVGVSSNVLNALACIEDNRLFIQEEVVAYVAANYRSYDTARCARDVGLIIDAVLYDMLFNSNYKTTKAGLSYLRAMAVPVLNSQLTETLGGITYAKNQVLALVVNDATATSRITTGFNRVLDIIENGESVAPAISILDGGYDAQDDNAKTILLNNKQFLKDEISAYLNTNYNADWTALGGPNQAKCIRDVGYIVDGLAYDLAYTGNTESVDAGLQYYYKSNLVIPSATKAVTLAAIAHLNSVAQQVVVNTVVTPSSGNVTAQNTSGTPADSDSQDRIDLLLTYVYDILDQGPTAAPTLVDPNIVSTNVGLQDVRTTVLGNVPTIKTNTITYINQTYLGFGYSYDVCKRDIGIILDSVKYDLLYGGNSQTKYAAEQYFSGGSLQIAREEKEATIAAYAYADLLVQKIILNTVVTPLQTYVDQDTSNPAATVTEVNRVKSLFDAATDIITNGYTSTVTLDIAFGETILNGSTASFHQLSIITAAGHTMEWIGTGTDINSALPYNGGVPIVENEIIRERGGVIYYTSTNQKGDFRIGTDLTIERATGSIVGRAFNKSLLGVMTPYILALEG